MKRIVLIITLLAFILSGCGEYQKLLKSDDAALKYKKAVKYYNTKHYAKAKELFAQLLPIYRGTVKAETIGYYMAYSVYGQKLYGDAGYLFQQFLRTFPDSPYAEECLYMRAYCYYKMSPKVRLDQEPTQNAINAFELYINRYPNSARVKKCNEYIDKLQDKLVYKSYLTGKNYYDREYYPSAIVALENCIKDYPNSSYRENLMFMLLESKYQLAAQSVIQKKRERYNNAKEEYYAFVDEFPESKYRKQAEKILTEIEAYLSRFNKKQS